MQPAIHSIINLLRHNPKTIKSYDTFENLADSCSDDAKVNGYTVLFAAIADLLEEHLLYAWDYNIPHKCEYDVEDAMRPGGTCNCGEPAAYRVFWLFGDEMWVCEEHFRFIRSASLDTEEKT
jgi:hypothetical protein